jgi:hypothetical protein
MQRIALQSPASASRCQQEQPRTFRDKLQLALFQSWATWHEDKYCKLTYKRPRPDLMTGAGGGALLRLEETALDRKRRSLSCCWYCLSGSHYNHNRVFETPHNDSLARFSAEAAASCRRKLSPRTCPAITIIHKLTASARADCQCTS